MINSNKLQGGRKTRVTNNIKDKQTNKLTNKQTNNHHSVEVRTEPTSKITVITIINVLIVNYTTLEGPIIEVQTSAQLHTKNLP